MESAPRLVRGIGTRGAIALNTISMIGIGPLITIPLVLGALHGPLSLVGWLAGALLAACDGLVWAELGSAYPISGGTYAYLRGIFGARGIGGMLGFLFVWQTIFVAPLNLATGYVGFANYAAFLVPGLDANAWAIRAVAVAVGALTLVALYRGTPAVARLGIVLAVGSIVTLAIVIVAGAAHFSAARAFAVPPHDSLWDGLRAGLGQALIVAMYDYLGYNQANCVGDEVCDPARTIPRSILISIGLVAALYVELQVGVLGSLDWRALVPLSDGTLPPLGRHVGSSLVAAAFGAPAAIVVTVLILVTAFASVYGNLLGYSRIPYAAAREGGFLRMFAHLHPTGRFPSVSLAFVGLAALPACLFPLDAIISALTAGSVLIGSLAQIAALVVRRSRGGRAPYRMWGYPVPAIVATIGWVYLFCSSGTGAIVFGVGSLGLGAVVYAVTMRRAPG